MRGRDPIVPSVASLLVPMLDALGSGGTLAPASRAALVLLTWFAIALLPPSRRSVPGPLTTLGYLGPPLGLGLGLDLAAGRAPGALALAALVSVVLLLLWGHARARATSGLASARAYALSWALLVPGVAALHVALDWAPRGTTGGGARAGWAGIDPLVSTLRWGAAGAEATAPWSALLAAVLVVVVVRLARTTEDAP